jgi:xanthine phosphoribosyltransferase
MTEKIDEEQSRIVTWGEVHRDARFLVRKLMKLGPWKGIIALTRGGLVPAAIVAREMDIHMIDTLCISAYADQKIGTVNVLKEPWQAVKERGEGWLLVDDLVDTGTTMKAARKLLPKAHFATVYAKPNGADMVDTYVHRVEQMAWVYFPWDTETRPATPLAREL